MEKPRPTFTVDQLLQQITSEPAGDCYTLKELCEKAGWDTTRTNKARLKRKIDDLRAKGQWRMDKKQYYHSEMGYSMDTYCYAPVEEGGGA